MNKFQRLPMQSKRIPIRVVVTGGRDYANGGAVDSTLSYVSGLWPICLLAHGDATGADRLAVQWARPRGVSERAYPYPEGIGKAGGPARNATMLQEIRPDIVVAFPGGRGTAGCVELAVKLGIPVLLVQDAWNPPRLEWR